MHSIAFVAFYFPPIGGGGTPRSEKFVKFLPEFGYAPTVFTVLPSAGTFNREFQPDYSYQGANEQVEVVRIQAGRNQRLRGWIQRKRWIGPLAWALAYPWMFEQTQGWSQAMGSAILRHPNATKFELLYVSAAPYSALVVASNLAKKLGIPWVADLRDLWTRDTLKFFPSKWHYAWEAKLERRTLSTASAIIANTPKAACQLEQWLNQVDAKCVVTIPNGFDIEDLPRTARSNRRKSAGAKITIYYGGTLYDASVVKSRLGRYRPNNLNNVARSIEPLVAALEILEQQHPDIASSLRVHLQGFIPPTQKALLSERLNIVSIQHDGIVPRSETIAAMHAAEVLFVNQVAWEESDKPMPYIPGKVYEYLATGKPILAPVGPGDLKQLLYDAPQAYVCDFRYPTEVATTLVKLISDLQRNQVKSNDSDWLSQFDRRNLTGRLASVFDGALVNTGQN